MFVGAAEKPKRASWLRGFFGGNVTLESNEASAGTEMVELCHRLPPQPAGAILKETGQFISLITMD